MTRDIVKIDTEKCNGCGNCVPNCHEGALQIINGKAVLISDLLCDGLGACLGHCPEGALIMEQREAEPYNEIKVIEEMVTKGQNVVFAHLKHLKEHDETKYLKQGFDFLIANQANISFNVNELINKVEKSNQNSFKTMQLGSKPAHNHGNGCPGSRTMAFAALEENGEKNINQSSQLSHWPIQLHLIQPAASHFHKADLLIAADCTAFSAGNFHGEFLKNHKLVIACPKLDSNKEIYVEKITRLIDDAQINTISVMIMEVPCCGGLLQIVKNAAQNSKRKVPIKAITLSIQGNIMDEEWV
jgi:NAD-dependent dihydropyrimidine dehydrogenase PreA subunit